MISLTRISRARAHLGQCIVSAACKNSAGYGHVRHQGKVVRENRLAYAQANGLRLDEIKGKIVRHRCDNPACVNPAHLILGTHTDNMRDMAERGRNRQPKGSKNAKAKIDEHAATEIRRRAMTGESGAKIASDFGVHRSQVSRIKNGKTWSHLV